ncbi:hypothetical protein ASG81_23140 [Paenibacillus sp. Soil522]|nr:hypothetical protein ASG81_23140 [Paenibacillus sp. Soil522]
MIRNREFYMLKHMKHQGMSTTRIAGLVRSFMEPHWPASRIPEILHTQAEEAAKHNHSYLSFSTNCCRKKLAPGTNALSA